MRKYILIVVLFVLTMTMVSWGYKGHKAIAAIAAKYLTAKTTTTVNTYLKGETMTDVSSWADEISSDQRYTKTASWHFLDVPLGLNRDQFTDYVLKQEKDNIYTAILKAEANLKDKSLSIGQKNQALKFLIHLVGDAHQPMHVSGEKDKNGNAVQLKFNGTATNLHDLWDNKLIDHEGLNYVEMARKYDWANAAQVKKWQADSPMQWLWESYQVSTQLYDDAQPGANVDEAYYKRAMEIIHLRIDQAGVRLAGQLNRIFSDENAPISDNSTAGRLVTPVTGGGKAAALPPLVKLTEIKKFVGKEVRVTGKVFSLRDIGSMVLVNIGAANPNQLLTLILKGKAKLLSDKINGKAITIQGKVIDYKSKLQMVVDDTTFIKL